MALVLLGGGVTDIRGSIGGTTFSRSKAGNYARARMKPVNPVSTAQQFQRQILCRLTRHWNNPAMDTYRAGWTQYAGATTWTNALGQVITIPGISAYLRTNAYRLMSPGTILDAAPSTGGHAGAVSFSFSTSLATQHWTITANPLGWDASETGAKLYVFTGLPCLQGSLRPPGPGSGPGPSPATAARPQPSPRTTPTSGPSARTTGPGCGWST